MESNNYNPFLSLKNTLVKSIEGYNHWTEVILNRLEEESRGYSSSEWDEHYDGMYEDERRRDSYAYSFCDALLNACVKNPPLADVFVDKFFDSLDGRLRRDAVRIMSAGGFSKQYEEKCIRKGAGTVEFILMTAGRASDSDKGRNVDSSFIDTFYKRDNSYASRTGYTGTIPDTRKSNNVSGTPTGSVVDGILPEIIDIDVTYKGDDSVKADMNSDIGSVDDVSLKHYETDASSLGDANIGDIDDSNNSLVSSNTKDSNDTVNSDVSHFNNSKPMSQMDRLKARMMEQQRKNNFDSSVKQSESTAEKVNPSAMSNNVNQSKSSTGINRIFEIAKKQIVNKNSSFYDGTANRELFSVLFKFDDSNNTITDIFGYPYAIYGDALCRIDGCSIIEALRRETNFSFCVFPDGSTGIGMNDEHQRIAEWLSEVINDKDGFPDGGASLKTFEVENSRSRMFNLIFGGAKAASDSTGVQLLTFSHTVPQLPIAYVGHNMRCFFDVNVRPWQYFNSVLHCDKERDDSSFRYIFAPGSADTEYNFDYINRILFNKNNDIIQAEKKAEFEQKKQDLISNTKNQVGNLKDSASEATGKVIDVGQALFGKLKKAFKNRGNKNDEQ